MRPSRRPSRAARKPASPPEPLALVGRGREFGWVVTALYARAALVTVTGPGGVGKSVLAAAVARAARASGRFPGGVCEVALGGVSTDDPRVLVARVASALGLPAHAREGRDKTAEALAARGRALVVLDECEGAIEALAHALSGWREAATDVAWLLTSRRALAFRDEQIVALRGLAPASAVELLTTRVKYALPGWSPSDDDRDALERIARTLEGLPLALELAASSAAAQGLRALAEALQTHPLRLVGGADRRARHRSLQSAVESSVSDLGPAALGDLASLATLRASFDLDAAAAITGRALADARGFVSALLARSLARVDDAAGRFQLFAAVRAFGAEQLGSDASREAARARHALHFTALAAQWTRAFHDGDAAQARERFERSLDDLFAAAAWAGVTLAQRVTLVAALDAALTPGGGSDALDGLLDETVAWAVLEGDATAQMRARAARARGRFLRGQVARAEEDLAAAWALDGASASARREAGPWYSAALRGVGRTAEARALAEEAMARAERDADPDGWLRAAHQRASARAAVKEYDAAREEYLELLATARGRGARRMEALCLANLGLVAEEEGRGDEAALRLTQGIAAFVAVGEQLLAAKLTARLARLLLHQGALDAAAVRVREAGAMARALRDQETAIEAALVGARLSERQGRHAEAAVAVEDAFATARALGLDELARTAAQMRAAPRAANSAAAGAQAALRVGAGAYWFEARGGPRVELGRRPSLRRVLAHLTALRASSPGAVASAAALLAEGWPGEKVQPEAGAERVYTAVRTLRAMGLEGVLVRRDGGYALDPAVPLAQG